MAGRGMKRKRAGEEMVIITRIRLTQGRTARRHRHTAGHLQAGGTYNGSADGFEDL